MNKTLTRTHTDLANFLVHHRQRLSPADVSLPSTGGRRTPGLRREEVAALAGVGLTWYTWFEQGRDIQVSEDFLLKVAKALRLDDVECHHLFLLAHRRPPPLDACFNPVVSPLIQRLLDENPRPAYVMNLRWDVIAWNDGANRLFGFTHRDPKKRNILYMLFADTDFQQRLPAWHEDAPRLLAQFRLDLAAAPDDLGMTTLVNLLKKHSSEFRHWMATPEIDNYRRGFSKILDEEDQPQDYLYEMLVVDEYCYLRMLVYFDQS